MPNSGTLNQGLIRSGSSCPAAGLADKLRWLALARPMFEKLRSVDSAETLAMALAASGDFSAAIRLQQSLLTNTPGGGARRFAHGNLERYRQNEIAVRPWPADNPFYSPPPAPLADKRRMAGLPPAP